MAQLTVYAKDFEGYIPTIDPRRLGKPTIMSGANFLFDVDGPRSAFGAKYLNYAKFDEDNKIKPTELNVGEEVWYGTPRGIFRPDPVTGEMLCMLSLPTQITNLFWPWTTALCGGRYYFAQYGIGLWEYNPVTNAMTKITTPVADANVKFLSASYGRLLVLFTGEPSDGYMWSALDNGRDFEPSLTTSAGADTCARTGGRGFRIDAVADGFIVSTSNGIIKATYVGTNYLWQHRVLSYEIKIFGPNCGTLIPDVGVILMDRSGMYITNGDKPQAWEPLLGEYFKKNQLRDINANQIGCVSMTYSLSMKAVWIGFAPSSHEGNFSAAFVYLTTSVKWGLFNKTSWGFVDMLLPITGLRYMGYMDHDGYLQYFIETYQCDIQPFAPFNFTDVLFRPYIDRTMAITDGVYNAYDAGLSGKDLDGFYYEQLTQMGLYYPDQQVLDDQTADDFSTDPETDPTTTPISFYTNWNIFPEGPLFVAPKQYILPTIGLNSVLEIGLFRFTEQQAADETAMIFDMIVGLTAVANFFQFEDWNVLFGDEDWNEEEGFEDWGSGSAVPDEFFLTLYSTNDGFNIGAQGPEPLYITNNMGGSNQYSPQGWSSIYHKMRFSASQVGQGFALKFIDISGQTTGRMTING